MPRVGIPFPGRTRSAAFDARAALLLLAFGSPAQEGTRSLVGNRRGREIEGRERVMLSGMSVANEVEASRARRKPRWGCSHSAPCGDTGSFDYAHFARSAQDDTWS